MRKAEQGIIFGGSSERTDLANAAGHLLDTENNRSMLGSYQAAINSVARGGRIPGSGIVPRPDDDVIAAGNVERQFSMQLGEIVVPTEQVLVVRGLLDQYEKHLEGRTDALTVDAKTRVEVLKMEIDWHMS